MKKILICFALVIGVLAIAAKTRVPKTVQGVPYTPKTADGKLKSADDWEWVTPDDMAGDGSFTFDMIKNWTGEGENQAALVIQWNDDDEPAALVFGFRWSGQATGADMMKAVAKNNPRLYTLMQYTNVASPTDPNGGYTINGIGWDVDDDGDIALIDTGNNKQVYESEDGFFEHPRGYKPGSGGSSDYDYDNWIARDADDMWHAGWYRGYWSYWVKNDFSANFGYSSWGASGRVLVNGSWDAWSFTSFSGGGSAGFKKFVAAPASIPADAKLEFENDGLFYTLKSYSKKTVSLVAPKSGTYTGEVTVPSTFVDEGVTYTVVAVADAAFANSTVTTVELPSTVTALGKEVFMNSTLTTLQVPSFDGITKIGTGVFAGCANFSTLVIPSWMTAIPDRMFEGTALTQLDLPAQVETVGARAFAACSKFTEINIPATVKAIGDEAFADADAVTSVKVASTYPLDITDGTFSPVAYANATLMVPTGYTADYAAAAGWKNFANKSEYLINVNVGDIFKVGGVTYVVTALGENNTVKTTYCKIDGDADNTKVSDANKAYEGAVTVPAEVTYQGKTFKVTEMGDKTFYGAGNITSVVIKAPIEALGEYAFYDCGKLANVELPSSLKKLGTNAFAYCESLESINLPEGLEDFGTERTFCWCSKLKTVNIPAGVASIPRYSFYGTAIEEFEFPSTVTTIGANVFQSCPSLKRVVLPEGLEAIPSDAFSSSSVLETVVIPETVKTIGSSAFKNCKALEIALPSGITTIGNSAFQGCTKLTEFTLPSSLTAIPTSLFSGCTGLVTVRISDNTTRINSSAFNGCTKLANVVYADGQTGFNLPTTLTVIDSNAFYGCSAVTEVELPSSITTLGGTAFASSGVKTLILPNKTVNYSNSNIVQNCTGVKVYSAATTPGSCGSYTWRVTGTTFASVVVPTGCKSAYSSKSYWSKSSLSSPELQGVKVADLKVTKRGENLEITGKLAGVYDIENMPAAFVAANDVMLFGGKTVSLSYLASADSRLTRAVEGMTAVDVALDADASFAVTVPDTNKSTAMSVALEVANGEETLTSATVSVDVIMPFAYATADYDAHFDESFTPELVFNTDEYALSDLTFTSSDTKVASVNSRTGAVSVKREEGDAVITAQSKTDATVMATMTVHAALRTPVTGFVLGDGSKTIDLTYLDILALSPAVEPANADVQTYDVSVSDPDVATTYSVRAFNPSRSFFELITHKPGTVDVTFTAQDGSGVSTTYTVNVVEPDRTPLADNYQNGTFWLNEEWFGHTNGSINYITEQGEMKYRVYESQNPYESFGATSQYGIIHGDKLIVMSKQATDGGDPRKGGGRVVVADAKTLKKLAAFDEFANGGDGRACVGVSEDKVYLGSTAGVQVLNTKTLTLGAMVDGISAGSQYSGQIGDMVAIGKYAFAIQQATGVYAIDIATDKVVKTFPVADDETTGVAGVGYPQGITVTADGNVWVATTAGATSGLCTFRCIDPSTLEVVDNVTLPESQRVTCGWGAWRSTNFFASKKENAIWYGAGVEASIVSGNSGYYKWTVGTDISNIQPVFVFPKQMEGIDSKTFQAPYASVRYDDRADQLLIAATHGASSNYRYNWLHFVDCKTGDIAKTIRLKDYYWFPSMPIFPDKYAPEFSNLPDISVDLAKADDVCTVDLKEYVSDKDNIDAAIRLSLLDANSAANAVEGIVDAELNDGVLQVKPVAAGHGSLTVKAESNGKTTTISIPYVVEDSASGINDVHGKAATVTVTDNIVTVRGLQGVMFTIYDVAGRTVGAFVADSGCSRFALTLSAGVYVLTSADGSHTLKFAIK